MATVTARKIIESGLAGSLSTCTPGGDDFVNTGVEFVRIQNDHASATYTVTAVAQTTAVRHPTYGNLTKSNPSISVVGHNSCAYMGPFKQNAFNDSDNKVSLTYIRGSGGSPAISGSHWLKIEILHLDNQ